MSSIFTELVNTKLEQELAIEQMDQKRPNSDKPNERTVAPNGSSERSNAVPTLPAKKVENEPDNILPREKSVIAELNTGPSFEQKRATERYSFEIYSDQIQQINKLKYLYQERFGKRLTKSRIIRDALDELLTNALRSMSDSDSK